MTKKRKGIDALTALANIAADLLGAVEDSESSSSISTSSSKRPRIEPSEEELSAAKTNRDKVSLRNWYDRLNELYAFKEENGHTMVPQQYERNPKLGVWVNKQRQEKKVYDKNPKATKYMTKTKVTHLVKADFNWSTPKGEPAWEQKFREIVEYKKQHGNCNVGTKYALNRELGRWVSTQRAMYKMYQKGEYGSLTAEQTEHRIKLLSDIGFVWDPRYAGTGRKKPVPLNDDLAKSEKSECSNASTPAVEVSPPSFATSEPSLSSLWDDFKKSSFG